MSEADLKRLRSERTQLRKIVTIAYKTFNDLLINDDISYEELEIQFKKTSDKIERLFKIDQQVSEILFLLIDNEKQLDEEYDSTESYREKWITICHKWEKLSKGKYGRDNVPGDDSHSTNNSNEKIKHHFNLPKYELPKYDGQIKGWISFWAQFRKVHEDPDLDNVDRFRYLLQATKPGSPARELVESFPLSEINYPKALDLLKSRFGNEDLLKRYYVRELLKLILNKNSTNKMELRKLYDQLVTQLRSLETLSITADQYACFLFPLVESAIPEDVLKEWNRQKVSNLSSSSLELNSDQLTELLKFLEREVECEERLALARSTFSDSNIGKKENNFKKFDKIKQNNKFSTATDLINVNKSANKFNCLFCNGSHFSENCFRARSMKAEELKTTVKGKGGCFRCLRGGHTWKQCKVTLRCIICDEAHQALLCPHRENRKKENEKQYEVKESLATVSSLAKANYCNVLLQTLVVTIEGEVERPIRVLIDTGSQRTYITKKLVRLMGFNPLHELKLAHALFGGTRTEVQTHHCYKVKLCNLEKTYCCEIEALDSETICNQVPVAARGPWVQELAEEGICLTDSQEGPVDALIGADIAGKLMTGKKKTLSSGLVAVETYLGWTVMGSVENNTDSYMSSCNLICSLNDNSITELWKLDVLGIKDPVEVKSKKERELEIRSEFEETVNILEDNRYEVRLPWVKGCPVLNRNFDLARKRLDITYHKLEKLDLVGKYNNVFKDWLKEGIIEEVSVEEWDKGHYMPHRPVLKEGSTTPIRPVFDASAGKPSLNQCLEKGINLLEVIPTLLLRFRLKEVGIIADVKKAFLQIALHKDDRDYLRFLWYEKEEKILKIYRHKRVVFGVTSSPFLLSAVFEHLLNRCEYNVKQGLKNYSIDILQQLRRSLYVDNCVTSIEENQVSNFIRQTTDIFSEALFEMRGWEYTNGNLAVSSITPVLGMAWDRKRDVIKVKFPVLEVECSEVTRRTMLAIAQRVFDPLGVVAPVTLVPKLLIQNTWVKGDHWDSLVDEETRRKFLKWIEEVKIVEQVELPRWLIGVPLQEANLSLHTFCDASQSAYATVIYLRIECGNNAFLKFLSAKSRVAPVKKCTIPRLELLAAVIGARLCHDVRQEFSEIPTFYWSDSTTTLAWINRGESWGVFVKNRVEEILKLTNKKDWMHVPGRMNPADVASRGCSPDILMENKWWEGPAWLKQSPEEWPSFKGRVKEEEVQAEIKRTAVAGTNVVSDTLLTQLCNRFSSHNKIVRIVAWLIRFCTNLKNREKQGDCLSVPEIRHAELILLRLVQEESFSGIEDERLSRLRVFKDDFGLLRVRTQITMRKDVNSFKEPIVLPSNHNIINRLILEEHFNTGHAVAQTLVSHLRENYWILRARQTVRRVVKNCVICKRYSARNFEVETPALPEARVRDAKVFEVTGTDFAGPLYLRNGEKAWICIFTCAVYRAIHLEVVSGLSTEALMMAFRRFIARRGRPSLIYSDNGTNYRGMYSTLRRVNWNKIAEDSGKLKIEWRFSPPSAPWWGGFWERLIRIMKTMLRKILGRSSLQLEELCTVVCECESYINSRPITYVSEDSQDPIALTPRMFLQEIEEIGVPDFDLADSSTLTRRLKHRLRLKEALRKRFRIEYLGQLLLSHRRTKNSREPMVGELVMVGDEKKRVGWPLAIVEKIISGKDGKCRVLQLRTKDGTLTRPIQRIYPLELPQHHFPKEE